MAKMSVKRYVVHILLVAIIAMVAIAFTEKGARAQGYPSGMVAYWKFIDIRISNAI